MAGEAGTKARRASVEQIDEQSGQRANSPALFEGWALEFGHFLLDSQAQMT
jgi:hypothetical protein